MSSENNTESGKEKHQKVQEDHNAEDVNDGEELRFSAEEEAALMEEFNTIKADATALFSSKQYHDALDSYISANGTCPKYLYYPRAVIFSNISACYLKLDQWKDAAKAASDSLDALDKLERNDPRLNAEATKDEKPKEDEDVEEEIISTGASTAAPATPQEDETVTALKSDIQRIRSKALMRRARARSEEGGWHNLAGAEEDYKVLASKPEKLGAADLRIVRQQLRELPPRTKVAQEKEMGEMWGKLKDLGNGILKPFGLSTNNFQMVKDEKTGGYSMNFQGAGGSS